MSATALAWLVTWTWQAAALTLVSTVVLSLATRTNASTRYLAWWITLIAVLALAVVPWSWLLIPEYSPARGGETPAVLSGASPGEGQVGLVEVPPVPLWIVGFGAALWAAYSGRRLAALGRSMARLRVVKGRCAPVAPPLERRLPLWMSVRHEGRSAQLCVSEDVATGCMLGLGAPIIALPQDLVAALPDADLERVVLHEYGHVQRRDDWTMLAQASIETLLGWHPAIWWIGRSLRLEREVACDDWVILQTAAPRDYASSLTKVAGVALKQPALPFAPRALRSRGELTGRVERLLDPLRNVAIRPIRSALAIGTLGVSSLIVLLGQTPPIVTVGVAAALPAVSRLSPRPSFDPPRLAPFAPSGRIRLRTEVTTGARARMANAQSERRPPPPRLANRTTLLTHSELSGLRGLTPPDTLKPALERRHLRPVLRSSEFAVDAEFAFPMNVSTGKPAELRRKHRAMDADAGPWGRIAYAGRRIGDSASSAGVATAAAFQTVGSSVARVFVDRR